MSDIVQSFELGDVEPWEQQMHETLTTDESYDYLNHVVNEFETIIRFIVGYHNQFGSGDIADSPLDSFIVDDGLTENEKRELFVNYDLHKNMEDFGNHLIILYALSIPEDLGSIKEEANYLTDELGFDKARSQEMIVITNRQGVESIRDGMLISTENAGVERLDE